MNARAVIFIFCTSLPAVYENVSMAKDEPDPSPHSASNFLDEFVRNVGKGVGDSLLEGACNAVRGVIEQTRDALENASPTTSCAQDKQKKSTHKGKTFNVRVAKGHGTECDELTGEEKQMIEDAKKEIRKRIKRKREESIQRSLIHNEIAGIENSSEKKINTNEQIVKSIEKKPGIFSRICGWFKKMFLRIKSFIF